MQKYWAVETRADCPLVPGDWLSLEGYGRRCEYPSEDFFRTGPDAVREDFTVFNLHGSLFGSRLDIRPSDHLSFGGGVEYQKPRIAPGKDRNFPPIDARFDDVEAGRRVPFYLMPALGGQNTLRGALVFGTNSLDFLIGEEGRRYIKHYMFDFGSTLGSDISVPQRYRAGNECLLDWKPGWLTLATLGIYTQPWLRIPCPPVPP
jgi:hypothetical protein